MTDSLGAGKVKPSKTRTHSDWGKILADYGKAHNLHNLHYPGCDC